MRHWPAKDTLGVFVLLAVAFACFVPGLSSIFLFDDIPNLAPLTNIAQEPWFSRSFWEYVFSGDAGPLGRPVSLFTFALQANSWPDDPFAIKLVNLLIHLGNGVLVYCICRRLASPLGIVRERASLFSLSAAALWLLHPVHVSVVLFAVQRMTSLAGTFMLLGVLLHLQLRLSATTSPESRRFLLLSASLAITGLCGLLAKESAAVMLCYLLTLEYTVLAGLPTSRLLLLWRRVFLWLPLSVLILLLIWQWATLQQQFALYRDFTMLERALSEPRVLWSYLLMLIVPGTANLALFQQPGLSLSLFDPSTTILALAAWAVVIAGALYWRRRAPVVAFAVFWYLGGHLIESTILPLGLMFNHRNYLPFMGPLIALGYCLAQLTPSRRAAWTVAAVLCAVLAFQSQRQSMIWSDPLSLAASWYRSDPHNTDNIEFFAVRLAETGAEQAQNSAALYQQLIDSNPGADWYLLNRLLLSCKFPALPMPAANTLQTYLQTQPHYQNDTANPLQQLMALAEDEQCPGLDSGLLSALVDRSLRVAKPEQRGQLEFLQGRLALINGKNDADGGTTAALADFQHAYELSHDPGIAYALAGLNLRLGNNAAALAMIDEAEATLQRHNDITTGSRATKLEALERLRTLAKTPPPAAAR
ncbi:MAG TPA: hypothetical protein VMH83_01770 [Candidatus Acidoferrum sp.]|nr:hypothetical protein [Candidatus Acidoferrum sp.]